MQANGGSSAAAEPIVQQCDKALKAAFEKSITPFRSVHSHFTQLFGSSSAAAAAAASTKESDAALRTKIDQRFLQCFAVVVRNSLAEMDQILSEPHSVTLPSSGSGAGSSSGSGGGGGMDIDSGSGSAGADDSADSESVSTPNKKRGGKKSSKSKAKSPAPKSAASAAAAADAGGSASGSGSAAPVTAQVTLREQLALKARLTALQPKLNDNTFVPPLESAATIEQRMRDAAAQTKIAQRAVLQQRLKTLQAQNETLSKQIISKRHAVQQIQAHITDQLRQLGRAMDACNIWKPPAAQPQQQS